jgi:hypothetical protein
MFYALKTFLDEHFDSVFKKSQNINAYEVKWGGFATKRGDFATLFF